MISYKLIIIVLFQQRKRKEQGFCADNFLNIDQWNYCQNSCEKSPFVKMQLDFLNTKYYRIFEYRAIFQFIPGEVSIVAFQFTVHKVTFLVTY